MFNIQSNLSSGSDNRNNPYNVERQEIIAMNCSDEQLKFSVYIINQIAQAIRKPTSDVYKYLSESGVLDEYIIGCYDSLHTLGREYLVDDVVELLRDRGVAI